jgi:hypothetical protein
MTAFLVFIACTASSCETVEIPMPSRPACVVLAQQALAAWAGEHPQMTIDFARPYRCTVGERA